MQKLLQCSSLWMQPWYVMGCQSETWFILSFLKWTFNWVHYVWQLHEDASGFSTESAFFGFISQPHCFHFYSSLEPNPAVIVHFEEVYSKVSFVEKFSCDKQSIGILRLNPLERLFSSSKCILKQLNYSRKKKSVSLSFF